ncbi:hypothetical protein D3C75_730210 [compost metagenome]
MGQQLLDAYRLIRILENPDQKRAAVLHFGHDGKFASQKHQLYPLLQGLGAFCQLFIQLVHFRITAADLPPHGDLRENILFNQGNPSPVMDGPQKAAVSIQNLVGENKLFALQGALQKQGELAQKLLLFQQGRIFQKRGADACQIVVPVYPDVTFYNQAGYRPVIPQGQQILNMPLGKPALLDADAVLNIVISG